MRAFSAWPCGSRRSERDSTFSKEEAPCSAPTPREGRVCPAKASPNGWRTTIRSPWISGCADCCGLPLRMARGKRRPRLAGYERDIREFPPPWKKRTRRLRVPLSAAIALNAKMGSLLRGIGAGGLDGARAGQKKPCPRGPKGYTDRRAPARPPGVGETGPIRLRARRYPRPSGLEYPASGRKGRSLMRNSFLVHCLYELGRTAIAFSPTRC